MYRHLRCSSTHCVPLDVYMRNSSTNADVRQIDLLLLSVCMRHFGMQDNKLSRRETHAGHVMKARLAVRVSVH